MLVCVADIWKHTEVNQIIPSCGRSFVILTFLSLHHHNVIRTLFIPIGSQFLQFSLNGTLDLTADYGDIHSPAVDAGFGYQVQPPGTPSFPSKQISFFPQCLENCCSPFNMLNCFFQEKVWPRFFSPCKNKVEVFPVGLSD